MIMVDAGDGGGCDNSMIMDGKSQRRFEMRKQNPQRFLGRPVGYVGGALLAGRRGIGLFNCKATRFGNLAKPTTFFGPGQCEWFKTGGGEHLSCSRE